MAHGLILKKRIISLKLAPNRLNQSPLVPPINWVYTILANVH